MARITCELAGAIALVRPDQVESMVSDRSSFGGRRLRGPDIHSYIDLSRVHRDDLALELSSEAEGEFGLPDGGGSGDDDTDWSVGPGHAALSHGVRSAFRVLGVRALSLLACHGHHGRGGRYRRVDRRAPPSLESRGVGPP